MKGRNDRGRQRDLSVESQPHREGEAAGTELTRNAQMDVVGDDPPLRGRLVRTHQARAIRALALMSEPREVLSYPDTAILTQQQVADWLQVSVRAVQDWHIPRLRYPVSHPRYSARMVLAWLEGKAE